MSKPLTLDSFWDDGKTPSPSAVPLGPSLRLKLLGAFLAIFALFCFMDRGVGMTWDEPEYLSQGWDAARVFQAAFSQLLHLNVTGALHTLGQPGGWMRDPFNMFFQRDYNGLVVSLLGQWIPTPWLQRGATAFAWAVMALLLFLLAREAFGISAGWAALLMALGTPRLVGHGLLSCTDCFLAVTWTLALWVYLRCFKGKFPTWWKGALWAGVACGVAMTVKFQSFALLGTLSIWGFLYAPRRAVKIFLVAFPVSLVVFLALSPFYWPDPVGRLLWLVNYYALRSPNFIAGPDLAAATGNRNVIGPVNLYFLGKVTLNSPWYYSLFIWPVSTPLPYLALSLWGCWKALKTFEPHRLLFLGLALVALTLPMAPGTNIHDGERLFLQAYPAWILVAAGGLSSLWVNREKWRKATLAGLVLVSGFILIRNYPFYLNYYGLLIGGPVGAEKMGFESSYWLDAITPNTLAALNREVPANKGVCMSFGNHILGYYKGTGQLRQDIQVTGSPVPGITTHRLEYLRQGYMNPVEIENFLKAPAVYEENYRGLPLVKLEKIEP